MSNAFWDRIHGGSTHFPIALVFASLLFDVAGCVWPAESRRRNLHAAGFFALLLGAIGSLGAVGSGLVMTHWDLMGSGLMAKHHFFIWPAFGLMIVLAFWRSFAGVECSPRFFRAYLPVVAICVLFINLAAFWGGEMLLRSKLRSRSGASTANPAQSALSPVAARGRALFLVNCAHCHADDATGDEGPDLHGVKRSDERIAELIKSGIKGEMPKFREKLSDEQVSELIAYLRSL